VYKFIGSIPFFRVDFRRGVRRERQGLPNKAPRIENMTSSICHFVAVISVRKDELAEGMSIGSDSGNSKYSLLWGVDIDGVCDHNLKEQVGY